MSRTLPFAAVLGAVATLATLDVAAAQQPLAPVQVRATATDRNSALVEDLEGDAATYAGRPRHWREAAHLYQRAADLRGAGPLAAANWRMAAWAYVGVQDLGNGRAMMEYAAECAASYGDVERAANAFIDAALIALADGRDDRVGLLVNKARMMTASPLLMPDQREAILRRIGDEPGLVRAADVQR